jgi:hypothetical protein
MSDTFTANFNITKPEAGKVSWDADYAALADFADRLGVSHMGPTEPAVTAPCMFWADTNYGFLKQRNATNDGWITLYPLASGPVYATAGTWTYDVKHGTTSVDAYLSGYSTGIYIKMGNFVYIQGYIIVETVGSGTGAVTIAGLPYTIGSSAANNGAIPITVQNVSYTGMVAAIFSAGTNYLSLFQMAESGATGVLTDSSTQDDSRFFISGGYTI